MSFGPPQQQPGWPPQPYGYPPSHPPASKPTGWNPAAIIAIIGAALILVGSLLDWIVVAIPFGEITRSGIDTDDGKLAAGLAVVALTLFLIGASTSTKAVHVFGVLASIGGGAIAVFDIIDVQNKANDISSEFASGSVGVGLYVCALGALAGVVCGTIAAAITYR